MVRKEKKYIRRVQYPGTQEKKMFQWAYYIIEKYIYNGEYRYQVNILQMNSKNTEAYREMQK